MHVSELSRCFRMNNKDKMVFNNIGRLIRCLKISYSIRLLRFRIHKCSKQAIYLFNDAMLYVSDFPISVHCINKENKRRLIIDTFNTMVLKYSVGFREIFS